MYSSFPYGRTRLYTVLHDLYPTRKNKRRQKDQYPESILSRQKNRSKPEFFYRLTLNREKNPSPSRLKTIVKE